MKLLLSRVVIPFERTGNLTGLSHSNKPPGFAYTLTYIQRSVGVTSIPYRDGIPFPHLISVKTLALHTTKTSQTTGANTLDRSASSIRDRLNKMRNSNPTPEGFKSTPVFKKPPPRFHNTFMGRSHGHRGSYREHKITPDNPLQTSQTSQHGTPRVEKIVKVPGKPAVKDILNPKQRQEYRDRAHGQRQIYTQPTLHLCKTAENMTLVDNKQLLHKPLIACQKTTTRESKVSSMPSHNGLVIVPATRQCRGLNL